MEKIEYKDARIGDYVYVDGDSGFCTPNYKKITGIETRYDSKTGEPYSIIVCGENEYRMDTGFAMTPPMMYYIVMCVRIDDEDRRKFDEIRLLREQHNAFIKRIEAVYKEAVDAVMKKMGFEGYYKMFGDYISFSSPYEKELSELEHDVPTGMMGEI